MNVPKLRFKEFNDEWCYQSLSKYVNRITTKNKNNESDLVLTISAQYGLVDQTFFFNRSVSSSNLTGYYLLNNGDFAYNKSYSNGYPWGAIKRLNKYNQGVVSSLYICFKTNNLIDSNFLEQYFETNKWYQQISEVSVEGARNHGLLNIAVNDFFNTKHYIPSIKEQEKISKFLSLLDKKIELQTKKIEDLKLFKKGLSNNIFNNLKNFEEYKLGDLCNITTGKLDANAMVENGKYRFYTCAKEYSFIDEYSFDTEALLISGNGAYVGYIHYYNGKFNAYQRTYILHNFKYNVQYIKCYLDEYLSEKINLEKKDGNTPYIVLSTLSDMIIKIPSSFEQLKISKIINICNCKLEIEKNKLIKLKELKKGLMQNMFV